MKTLLVFGLYCMVSAFGGVTEDTEEQHNWELYRRYCLSGLSSSSGRDGDLEWHCKISQEPLTTEIIDHELKLPIKNINQQLIVFIEIPSEDYYKRDNSLGSGHEDRNHNTRIVLVPAEAALISNPASLTTPIWLLVVSLAFMLSAQ